MPIPGQTFNINENGLGLVTPVTTIPLWYGYSSLGIANVLKTYNSITDLVAGQGQGPAVEGAAYDLANYGGPIRFMRASTSVAGTNSTVTNGGGGPAVTVAGNANDDYLFIGKIVVGGVLGVATFQYSLDNGTTWSEIQTVPSGGTFAIPSSGLTLTFPAGVYIAGSTYSFSATAPMWNATDLNAAFQGVQADSTEWDFIVAAGRQATGAAGAVLAAALQSQLTTLANQFRWKGGMLDAGDEATTSIITAFGSTIANRVLVSYRGATCASAKPFPGWSVPKVRALNAIGARAHGSLISTDLGRVASGPVPGVQSIEHDEYKTEVMDAQKISTLRTIPGLKGFFITNGNLKSASGSDFKWWQFRRNMDVACAAVYQEQAKLLNSGVRAAADGTIDERDAARVEARVNAVLHALLLQPKNEEGTPGHVSDVVYTVNRSVVITTTSTIQGEVAIQPLGYAKYFVVNLGFVAQILARAA